MLNSFNLMMLQYCFLSMFNDIGLPKVVFMNIDFYIIRFPTKTVGFDNIIHRKNITHNNNPIMHIALFVVIALI